MEFMPTKAGAGRSIENDSFTAGKNASEAAFNQAGIDICDFAFLFSTVGYNREELLKGVRSVTGNAPLCGCTGEGVITQNGPEGEVVFTNSGPKAEKDAAGVMVISSDELDFQIFCEKGMFEDSVKAGEKLGSKVNRNMPENPLVFWLLADSIKSNVKNFFDGFNSAVDRAIPCCGGLSGDNFILGKNFQFYNDQILTDSASCVLISGDLNIEIEVSHGCMPIGLEKTITKSRGNIVYEIDNIPAWDFFKQYLDSKWTKFTREIRTFLDFGIKLSDNVATEYDRFIIRAPMGQNEDGSLYFNTEMEEGTKVQVIRRDADKISNGAKAMAERIKTKLEKRKPAFILHVDCAARGKMFFGKRVKEKGIDVMQNVFGKDVPWLGFYSCGEIAPVKNINYLHNQTAVLCVFY
jgi:hypothetical protein